MTDTTTIPAPKTGGRFKPGNPGKPKGARNKATLMAEKLMARDAKGVFNVIVASALAGDLMACKLIADRIAPPPKATGRMVSFPMPVLTSMADVSGALSALLAAVSNGQISVDEANALSSVIERVGKAISESDLERRLDAVERAQNAKLIEHRGGV